MQQLENGLFIDKLLLGMDNMDRCIVFLEFTRAFDTVNHSILVHKPSIRGVHNVVTELV